MNPEDVKILSEALKDASDNTPLYVVVSVGLALLPMLFRMWTKFVQKQGEALSKTITSAIQSSVVEPMTALINEHKQDREEMIRAMSLIIEELKYLHDKADEHDERLSKLEGFKARSRGKKEKV